MARPRQPIDLVVAKGKKNLTKAEIKERRESEVAPLTDNIIAPSYLTKKQRKEFNIISEQLQALKIMSETDVDALARFIYSRELYIKYTKQLLRKEVIEDPWLSEKYFKNQDRAFKQCRASASDLGLTITARCRLVVPVTTPEEKPKNKFTNFEKVSPA